METRKFINKSGSLFLIPNHYNKSLASYLELVEEARLDFPSIKDVDVECREVTRSGWCKHMPIIVVDGQKLPETIPKDYMKVDMRPFDVDWR